EILLQLAALDEFHGDVPDTRVLAKVVDGNDIGMGQASARLRFAAKAGDDVGRVLADQLFRTNGFERDDALDIGIEAFVDDAHRPAAEFPADLVFAELADHLYLLSISHTDFWTRR